MNILFINPDHKHKNIISGYSSVLSKLGYDVIFTDPDYKIYISKIILDNKIDLVFTNSDNGINCIPNDINIPVVCFDFDTDDIDYSLLENINWYFFSYSNKTYFDNICYSFNSLIERNSNKVFNNKFLIIYDKDNLVVLNKLVKQLSILGVDFKITQDNIDDKHLNFIASEFSYVIFLNKDKHIPNMFLDFVNNGLILITNNKYCEDLGFFFDKEFELFDRFKNILSINKKEHIKQKIESILFKDSYFNRVEQIFSILNIKNNIGDIIKNNKTIEKWNLDSWLDLVK